MNVDKLEKLKEFILSEPRRYRQEFWLFGAQSDVVLQQQPPCGTAGCLAGNACLMEGYLPVPDGHSPIRGGMERVENTNHEEFSVNDLAIEILGLDKEEAEGIFDTHCCGWTKKARSLYHKAKSPEERANAAALELDALIERCRMP